MSFERCDKAFIDEYIEKTDTLIKEIENSPTNVEIKGVKYYVSVDGNDENDGLSPETPWKTVGKVNTIDFNPGDGVFFRRGDSFRQEFPLESRNGVTYSAYGEGKKPRIVASVDASGEEKWLETELPNVYKYYESIPEERDVGCIIFDDGRAWGIHAPKRADAPGQEIGHVFNGLEWQDVPPGEIVDHTFLCGDLQFHHEWDTQTLYLYSKDGNPGNRFNSIELGDKGVCMSLIHYFHDVTVDNLEMFGGTFGISAGDVVNVSIQYCTFKWIGGSIQCYHPRTNIPIRYGNAVESYGNSDGFYIHHCYATQVYDCCWTVQNQRAVTMRNISMHDNVTEFCNTGLEVWQQDGLVENLELYNNHTRFNGYGWSHQRVLKDGNFFYGASPYAKTYINCSIHDNINYLSERYGLVCRPSGPKQYNFNNNLYIMEEGTYVGKLAKDPATGDGEWMNYDYTQEVIEKLQAVGFEPGSKYYIVEKSPLDEDMFTLCLPKSK